MKHIFIINPNAGVGDSEKEFLPVLLHDIKKQNDDFEIHRSISMAETINYIKARCEQGEPVRFYAAGGDGTICSVVNGIMGFSNAELAVIPCGSGNDFVKNFTHVEYFKDLHRQINGTTLMVDVLQYNDSYCMNMANIGVDCDIVIKSEQLRAENKCQGAMSYATAAVQLLPKGKTYSMSYTDENGIYHEDERFMLVAVGNGKYCGGGFLSCPKASITDGKMDIGFVRLCRGAKLFQMLYKYHKGTHIYDKEAEKYVKYMQLSEFRLKANEPVFVSIDGESEPFTEAEFKVLNKAVRIVVPSGSELIP